MTTLTPASLAPATLAPAASGTLSDLFESQVDSTPEHQALVFEGTALSYTELDAAANRLARELITHGAGRGTVVALSLPRSVELVVALLAVGKTGAAFLPLDPDYPADRVAYMLDDSAALLVLTTAAGTAPPDRPRLVLDEPTVRQRIDGHDGSRIARDTEPDDPAYLLYTSGSTGRPKGVVVPQVAIVNQIRWLREADVMVPEDRVLQKSPSSFDVSMQEFFGPLSMGATLVLARPGGHRDPVYLAELVAVERITWIQFVPSLLRVFLAEPTATRCRGVLRRIVCNGEALPTDVAVRSREVTGARLFNLYGPTEAAVAVTSWECPADLAPGDRMSIGYPVSNTRLYVLDADLLPVPDGATGELYLAGIQLARGYLNRPGLTGQRFRPDPFGPPGERMYRTGDLVTRRPDGGLAFEGRIDDQVKIRGLRIELGEIEAVLRALPGVAAAAVAAREDTPGHRYLAGYLVARPGAVLDHAAILAAAAAKLPEHMVPPVLTEVEGLPLTPSGKLNRGALPVPDLGGGGEPPSGEAEVSVAGIWTDHLGVPVVDRDRPFLGFGGDSLLAARVLAAIRAASGVDATLAEFFANPTVRELAALVTARVGKTAPVVVAGDGPYPAAPGQSRLWVLSQIGRGNLAYTVSFAIDLSAPEPARAAHDAVERVLGQLAAAHESLRSEFVPGRGGLVVHTRAVEVPLDLLDLAGSEPAAITAAEAEFADTPLVGPLWRARLLRLAPGGYRLLVAVHHTVFDGLSADVFAADFRRRWSGSTGPAPTARYRDHAARERARAADPAFVASRVEAWRDLIGSTPPVVTLPAAKARPAAQGFDGAQHTVDLGDLPARVAALATGLAVSPFAVYLALFGALVAAESGQPDVLVGTPMAGRDTAGDAEVVGFYARTVPVPVRTAPDPDVGTLVKSTWRAAIAAQDVADIPFEVLVKEFAGPLDRARPPLMQVVLTYRRSQERLLRSTTAKFDLTIDVVADATGGEALVEYSTAVHDDHYAQGVLTRYTRLLDAACRDPHRRISALTRRP